MTHSCLTLAVHSHRQRYVVLSTCAAVLTCTASSHIGSVGITLSATPASACVSTVVMAAAPIWYVLLYAIAIVCITVSVYATRYMLHEAAAARGVAVTANAITNSCASA